MGESTQFSTMLDQILDQRILPRCVAGFGMRFAKKPSAGRIESE
jgi:hypothetical protein